MAFPFWTAKVWLGLMSQLNITCRSTLILSLMRCEKCLHRQMCLFRTSGTMYCWQTGDVSNQGCLHFVGRVTTRCPFLCNTRHRATCRVACRAGCYSLCMCLICSNIAELLQGAAIAPYSVLCLTNARDRGVLRMEW